MTASPALEVLARALADKAARRGRTVLLEHEAYELLHAAGFDVPLAVAVEGPGDLPDMDVFPGDRVVVKLLSPTVVHRTEIDGVHVVSRDRGAVARTVKELLNEAADPETRVLVQEFVPHDTEAGGELLLSARWSREFGAVVTLALGGVTAGVWTDMCRTGDWFRVWAVGADIGELHSDLRGGPLVSLATGGLRNRTPRVAAEGLVEVVERFLTLARVLLPRPLLEVEVNPLVFNDGSAVCLDGFARLAPSGASEADEVRARSRGADAMAALLRPRSLALVGVSARGINPGRAILRNVLAAGFPADAVQVVKAGSSTLDGCRCVPDVVALDPVDVLVLGVGAGEVPELLEKVTARRLAKSVILISGGLGEGGRGEEGARRLHGLLARDGAPRVNGGNCLGIRSLPGSCDTLFIPQGRLGFAEGAAHPVALISQSGAFAIARCSALAWLNPRYVITVGNQVDLTVGDWTEHLVDDPGLSVVACYVEGFGDGDGARFLAAARAHRRAGRIVLLYRAGRTAEGAAAMASHTASLAGDYEVTRALAEAQGVLVADSAREFSDLLTLAVRLADRSVHGNGVGLMSNAGFECVAMADRLGPLRAPPLGAETEARLGEVLAAARLEGIVAPRNPLDVTPILGDEGFVSAARALLADPAVDAGVVGCVPLTPALRTLTAGEEGSEELEGPGGVASGLVRLWTETCKAWVVSVDGGPDYDPLVASLQRAGIPVIRQADQAVALLGRYVKARLGGA